MKPIKTGIASYGLSGQVFHAPFIATHPGFELTAIVERSKELSRERYPDAMLLRSFDELIASTRIELVIVNTPDVTHYDYCKAALLADKHVVVEKPFVFSIAQAEELIALAARRGKLLTVYQNRRFDDDFRTVQNVVAGGELGRIVEFNSAFESYRNFIAEGTWKERSEKRVGLTYNLGSHSVDQALVLFGMPDGVWATLDVLRSGGEVDDYFNIVLLYPRLKVNLKAGYLMRESGPRFVVHGTLGSYMSHGSDPQEQRLKQGDMPVGAGWGVRNEMQWGVLHTDIAREKYPMAEGNYRLFYDNIYDCLRKTATPHVTQLQMLQLIRLLDACVESNDTGRVVSMR